MRQSIENKQETRPSEAPVTAMFHGSRLILGGNHSFFAPANPVHSVSGHPAVVSGGIWLSRLLKFWPDIQLWRRRTPCSLARIEQFFAEELIARSALAVFAANPKKRSQHAASSPITTMTEQRRCEAA